jgi:hypothetical protein
LSHIVQLQIRLYDPAAVAGACQRLDLAKPTHGTAKLYSGVATGLLVQLPGWKYPAIVDTATGTIQYDNFGGRWGDHRHLDQFIQMYAVEKAKIEARKRGHTVTEQQLTDGSIRLTIQAGGGDA